MNRQSLMALGIAVFIGLIAVILANAFLTAGKNSQTPDGMVKVAVAAVPLQYGTALKQENIRFINYPKDALPAGSFSEAAELIAPGKRRIALMPIAANELILAGKVTGPGAGASIAALLPEGKRAVSVRINDVSGVAGFIQPADSVDVLITRQIAGKTGSNEQVTDVLLQNTRVIAMGKRAKSDEEGKPLAAKTATLEVTPLEAQKLALGQQVGDLSLVLRKPGEQDDALALSTVSLEDLRYGTYAGTYRPQLAAANLAAPPNPGWTAVKPARAPVRKPTPKPLAQPMVQAVRNSVDVVRGTTQTSYEVGGFGG
ncbi:Flp pilus assembly protein CpaB [Sphingomonas rosea]